MVKIVYGSGFLKSVQKLPKFIQTKLADLLDVLAENPFNHQLHVKHLTGPLTGLLSFRITRDWRVTFRFLEPDSVQLVEAAHRKDIYR